MNDRRVSEKDIVTLCGVQGCCPTIDFTDSQNVILKDDFGGRVQLTRNEWEELKTKFSQKK
ncbi:hypothetical protein COX25_04630 [bacterium (Candidatus Howlettbacteria) CG23_combo_of_CG06-09_8_20_14_all_37_9]|nr:MAG: hypothetical protein COX25_04630 [bacterium (Candidatus Howlettbacteria) CG23_combo_of_CG06-09_8_20_14_all_37_9]